MWPLRFFESSTWCIPEIANAPSWASAVIFSIGMALFLVVQTFVWLRLGGMTWRHWVLIVCVGGPGILALVFIGPSILTLGVMFCGPVCAVLAVSAWERTQTETNRKIRVRLRTANAGSFAIVAFGAIAVLYSFPYYLPASYSAPRRDQLRMMRRIIQVEPHAGDLNRPIIPLSKVHLNWQGSERIPDSVRFRQEYEGYKYVLHPDDPRKGLFTLDATPEKYASGRLSYHAFPTNPEGLDEEYPYVVYCITLADRKGRPATDKDRHFHRREIWDWITGMP